MGKKASYNNQGMAIYIYGEDFEDAVEGKTMDVPAFIGKAKTSPGFVWVALSVEVKKAFQYALEQERKAMDEVRDQFAEEHPDYESSTDIQRRKQRRERRLRRRSDGAN